MDMFDRTDEIEELREMLRYALAYVGKAVSDGYLSGCVCPPERLLERGQALLERTER